MERRMERPGEKLKRARERLKLTYRDVEKASQQLARRRGNDEFAIALSRLADIENKQTVPSIYRIYSLSAIYRLDFREVLRCFGVPLELLASDALHIGLKQTHPLHFKPEDMVSVPQVLERQIDLNQTTFLSHMVRRWGKLGLSFLSGADIRQHRYGFLGLEDWSMYPILHPGSLLLIDPARRKIASAGWTSELDRPIYFFEHRERYICAWCTALGDRLIIQPHPASNEPATLYEPGQLDVIGQVTGVAMLLESRRRRPVRAPAVPPSSPDL
jgi:transcriptional regulator with XRE-family HTH domain